MTNRHILSPIVEKRRYEAGVLQSERYEYASKDGVPYVWRNSMDYNNESATRTIFKVNFADAFGNPLEYEANGMKSVLLWGKSGQLLLGRIDNLSYSEAIQLGLTSTNYEGTNPNYWYGIERKYASIPAKSHLYAYGYNGKLQLEKSMQPTGFTTYYKYDGFDRLREAYHYDVDNQDVFKRIMEVYDYKYFNE